MRKLCIFLMAAALAACGPTHTASTPVPPPAAGATADERALLAAEVAYSVANTAGIAAIRSGALNAAGAKRVRQFDADAHANLVLARQLYAIGDRSGAELAVAAMTGLLDQLRTAAGLILP